MFAFFKRKQQTVVNPQKLVSDYAPFTPDALDLYTMKWHRVFIYNECQLGQRAQEVLGSESQELWAAFTKQDNFVMWKKELGKETFPFAIEVGEENKFGRASYLGKTGKVKGFMFKMRPYDIVDLDNYMLNTVRFVRRRVMFDVPYRERVSSAMFSDRMVKSMRAWMYVANPEYWNTELKHRGHSQVKLYTAKHLETDYYYFNDKLENSSE